MQDETIVDICYCDKCLEQLEEWGHPSVSTFEIIVETCIIFNDTFKHIPQKNYIYQGKLDFIEIKNHPSDRWEKILDFLERKGFVNTSDVFDDTILDIVPKGIFYEGGTYYVCVDEKHDLIQN